MYKHSKLFWSSETTEKYKQLSHVRIQDKILTMDGMKNVLVAVAHTTDGSLIYQFLIHEPGPRNVCYTQFS